MNKNTPPESPKYYEFQQKTANEYRWTRAMERYGNRKRRDISDGFHTLEAAIASAWEHSRAHPPKTHWKRVCPTLVNS